MSMWIGLKWLMIGKIAEFCRPFVEIVFKLSES